MSIDGEKRAQHQQIDGILENLHDVLDDNAVQQALGAQTVSNLQYLSEQLFVPNIQHGVVTAPRGFETSSDQIPIFVAQPGQMYHIGPTLTTTTKSQQGAMDNTVASWPLPMSHEEFYTEVDRQLQAQPHIIPELNKPGESIRIAVAPSNRKLRLGGYMEKHFIGRPVVTIVPPASSRPHYENGMWMLHDMGHVLDFTEAPIIDAEGPDYLRDRNLRSELIAFHLQAAAASALYFNSSNPDYRNNSGVAESNRVAFEIEDLREETTQGLNDKFSPTSKLQRQLKRKGLSHIVL